MSSPEGSPDSLKLIQSYRSFLYLLAKWVFWGSLIGAASGSTSALLLNVNDLLTDTRMDNPWLVFLLPVGGLVIGFLFKYFGNDADKGNNLIYEHIHHGFGKIPLLMGPIVFVSTFLTHLFGGSTGREGAAIQMGGSIVEAVVRLFKIDRIDRKLLLMSGISGGFGSAFGAPLSGTIIGMEVASLGKLKYEALIPCLTASYVGHLVTMAWGVEHEHHVIQSVPGLTLSVLLKVVILSIIFSLVSVLYSTLRHGIQKLSEKHLKDHRVSAFIGGLAIVALVYILGTRDYLGRGLPILNRSFEKPVAPFAFLAKLVFTAITMGTGFRGGEVIPLFFMGATLGNALTPITGLPLSFMAALGMVSVFCGATNIPLTCFIFSIEAFDGKGAEFFLLACLISYIFSGNHGVWPAQKIYEPKSRLLGLPDGKTIAETERKKED